MRVTSSDLGTPPDTVTRIALRHGCRVGAGHGRSAAGTRPCWRTSASHASRAITVTLAKSDSAGRPVRGIQEVMGRASVCCLPLAQQRRRRTHRPIPKRHTQRPLNRHGVSIPTRHVLPGESAAHRTSPRGSPAPRTHLAQRSRWTSRSAATPLPMPPESIGRLLDTTSPSIVTSARIPGLRRDPGPRATTRRSHGHSPRPGSAATRKGLKAPPAHVVAGDGTLHQQPGVGVHEAGAGRRAPVAHSAGSASTAVPAGVYFTLCPLQISRADHTDVTVRSHGVETDLTHLVQVNCLSSSSRSRRRNSRCRTGPPRSCRRRHRPRSRWVPARITSLDADIGAVFSRIHAVARPAPLPQPPPLPPGVGHGVPGSPSVRIRSRRRWSARWFPPPVAGIDHSDSSSSSICFAPAGGAEIRQLTLPASAPESPRGRGSRLGDGDLRSRVSLDDPTSTRQARARRR